MSKPTDWKLRLDSILHDARAEAAGRQPAGKTASAPAQAAPATLVKQAEDVVAAIKLVTGQTSQATLAEILRKEGEAGKSPGVTSTTTSGTQAEPPRSGSASVTQSPGPKAARPTESAAGTKGASLHDIITRGREAAEKSAGKGGPAELEAGDPSGKTPAGLTKLVGTSEAAVDMTKRDALAQTRPSLQSLLKNVNDSANEAAARAAFPAAVAKGGLKIASDLEIARSLQKEGGNIAHQDPQQKQDGAAVAFGGGLGGMLGGAVGLGGPGAAIGAAAHSRPGRRLVNGLGAGVGAGIGGMAGMFGAGAGGAAGGALADFLQTHSMRPDGSPLSPEEHAVLARHHAGEAQGERTASATPHQIAIAMQRQQSAAAV